MTHLNFTHKGRFLITACLLLLFAACQTPQQQMSDKLGEAIEKTTLVDQQSAQNDSLTKYCYYLPKAYNGKDSLPVIFFLDPHAVGNNPINRYATLANKYGYILVASNSIRNGQAANYSLGLFKQLLAETKNRFLIDETRMFTSGFSGGAKMAIVFAQQLPEIIGTAACGASVPLSKDFQPHYYYAGIVGNEDFNYLEAYQTFTIYDQQGYDYTSVIFEGGHNWPPMESYEMAIIGFEIYTMKLKRAKKNTDWLDQVWDQMADSIALYRQNGNIIQESLYVSQTARWFYGLKNTQELMQHKRQIEQSNTFASSIRKRQKLIQTEVKLRSEFIRALELRDLDWWKQEITRIEQSTNQSDREVAHVSKRLLNYLSMVGFMLVKTDLEDSRLDEAAKKLKIYEWVDPTNADVYLMYARYYMQKGDVDNMTQSFNKAKNLGIKDYNAYKNDSFWRELLLRPELNS